MIFSGIKPVFPPQMLDEVRVVEIQKKNAADTVNKCAPHGFHAVKTVSVHKLFMDYRTCS
jgi:hypothetical protein